MMTNATPTTADLHTLAAQVHEMIGRTIAVHRDDGTAQWWTVTRHGAEIRFFPRHDAGDAHVHVTIVAADRAAVLPGCTQVVTAQFAAERRWLVDDALRRLAA